MTLFDFLAQAGFWQWVGIFILGYLCVLLAEQLVKIQLFTITKTDNSDHSCTWHKERDADKDKVP
jgi:hypothetical protein